MLAEQSRANLTKCYWPLSLLKSAERVLLSKLEALLCSDELLRFVRYAGLSGQLAFSHASLMRVWDIPRDISP